MRHQSLLLLSISLYLNFDVTDGQCSVPNLNEPLQWATGSAPTSEITNGGTADVVCDTGYTLVGTATLTCSDSTLSDLPTCEADCDDLGTAPTNGRKDGDDYSHESTVTYTCDDGYTLSGPGELTCTSGSWDHTVPTCTEDTATTEAAPTETNSEGTATNETTTTDADSENGAGVATFGYLMIPAVILALISN
ncbi:C4b-binding protein-like [Ptychodera flava]|uniref:C4b-binding protein-like n=1 Tax=Ptychodera flava TaxID=63121 RepID=UPI00396A6BAC